MKMKIDCSQPGLTPELVSLSGEEATDLAATQTLHQTEQSQQQQDRHVARAALRTVMANPAPSNAVLLAAVRAIVRHLQLDQG